MILSIPYCTLALVIPEINYVFMQPNWSAVSYFLHVIKFLNLNWVLHDTQVSEKKYIYVFIYDSRTEKEILIQQPGQETVVLTLGLAGSYALSGAHTVPWIYWPSQRCHTVLTEVLARLPCWDKWGCGRKLLGNKPTPLQLFSPGWRVSWGDSKE